MKNIQSRRKIARAHQNIIKHEQRVQHELERLQDQIDKYKHEGDLLAARVQNLDLQIDAIERRKLDEQRKRMERGGTGANLQQSKRVQKQVILLEKKKERLGIMIGKLENICGKLKFEIDQLRRERVWFGQLFSNFKEKFESKQQEMARMIETSNELYTDHEKAKKQLQELKHDKLQAEIRFKEEWDRLGSTIKQQEEVHANVKLASLKRRANELQNQIEQGSLNAEEEAKIRNKINQLNKRVEKKMKEVHQDYSQRIVSYEDAFVQLHKASGITDVTELVETFVSNDDFNFSLFDHIQRTNKEVESLEAELKHEEELRRKYIQEQDATFLSRKKIKSDLNIKVEKLRKCCRSMVLENKRKQESLSRLTEAAERLFIRINCKQEPIVPPSPCQRPVNRMSSSRKTSTMTTISNSEEASSEKLESIMRCLGCIEQKAIEITRTYDILIDKKHKFKSRELQQQRRAQEGRPSFLQTSEEAYRSTKSNASSVQAMMKRIAATIDANEEEDSNEEAVAESTFSMVILPKPKLRHDPWPEFDLPTSSNTDALHQAVQSQTQHSEQNTDDVVPLTLEKLRQQTLQAIQAKSDAKKLEQQRFQQQQIQQAQSNFDQDDGASINSSMSRATLLRESRTGTKASGLRMSQISRTSMTMMET